MTEGWTPDTDDFRTFVRNVLEVVAQGGGDGVDEALEAILSHPDAAALGMKVLPVMPVRESPPESSD